MTNKDRTLMMDHLIKALGSNPADALDCIGSALDTAMDKFPASCNLQPLMLALAKLQGELEVAAEGGSHAPAPHTDPGCCTTCQAALIDAWHQEGERWTVLRRCPNRC